MLIQAAGRLGQLAGQYAQTSVTSPLALQVVPLSVVRLLVASPWGCRQE